MSPKDPDRVEKTIELRAPRARVWRAIADPQEFAAWFGLGETFELVGDFVPGAKIAGKWKMDGRELVEAFCTIEAIEPERRLSFFWVPFEVPEGEDHAKQPTTRIEFLLEEIANGTRLTVVESGFSKLPADKQYKRDQNETGWTLQLEGIAQHILGRVEVKVEEHIARPVAEVFQAIVSRGSKKIEPNAKLEWAWDDAGAKLSVEIMMLMPNEKIIFVWSASGKKTKVTLSLSADGEKTKLIAAEAPFALTEEGVARALEQTRGWAVFGCRLRAHLEQGIDLRLGERADHAA